MSTHELSILNAATALFNHRQLSDALETASAAKAQADVSGQVDRQIQVRLLLSDIWETTGRYLRDDNAFQQAQEWITAARKLSNTHQRSDFELPTTYRWGNILLASKQAQKAVEVFKKLQESAVGTDDHFTILSFLGISGVAAAGNDFEKALVQAQSALNLLEKKLPEKTALKLEVYNQLSQIYFKLQDYDNMLLWSERVLVLSKSAEDIEKEMNALKNIAIYHAAKAEYKEAMQYFLESMNKSRQINHRVHTAQCLVNIATIYASLYNHKDAISRYNTLLEAYSEVISPNLQIVIYNNLGNIYYTSDRYDQAATHFEKAYELAQEQQNNGLAVLALANLSRTNIARQKIEAAANQAQTADTLLPEQGDINGRQINSLNLGHLHYLQKDIDQAIQLTEAGIDIAKRMKDDANEMHGYQLLSEIYQQQEDYKTALEYQMLYTNAQHQFSKKQRNRQIIDLEIKNAIREKQKEIEQLTKENQYQALLLKQNDQIAEQNAQLMAVNDELRQFAYVTSHDLKEPIRMIGSYTQLIERKHAHQFTENSLSYFKFVKEGVVRMNDLLDALLRYTTINRTADNFEKVSLVDVVDLAVINLRVRIQESDAVVKRHDLPEVLSIKSLLIQLFQNLISNGIKFKKPDSTPLITISYEETDEEIIIQVADNGIGIAPEFQERIFVIFQRLHTRSEYEGTGIGLAICHKIVQRLGGKIWVESEAGAGARFFVALKKT